jgi:magnesium chelatase family protein
MNPCFCGQKFNLDKICSCTPWQADRYMKKISGPLLDRIDIQLDIPALKYEDLTSTQKRETSAEVRVRVENARNIQHQRFGKEYTCNAEIKGRDLRKYCQLDQAGTKLLKKAYQTMGLSLRAHDRILRVARTIADLAGLIHIREEHLAEAIQYRSFEAKG